MTQLSAPDPGQGKDSDLSQSDLNENLPEQKAIKVKNEPLRSSGEKPDPIANTPQSFQQKPETKITNKLTQIETRQGSQGSIARKPVSEKEIQPKTETPEIQRLERLPTEQQKSRSRSELKALTIMTVTALTMLPVLGVGTATYLMGNKAITRQIEEARRAGATRLTNVALTQQRQLLEKLLLGTGITALAAGAISWLWARRALSSAAASNDDAKTLLARKNGNFGLEQSPLRSDLISQLHSLKEEQEILDLAVERVRKS